MLSLGAPGWLSRLSIRLWLRSWSHGAWVRVLRRALCWQLRAWSLFRILCLPHSLPLPLHALSLSVPKNKHWKKIKKKKKIENFKSSEREGCLGGSVSWASDFGSGHDLAVCEFKSHVRLCADSSEPGACFRFCVSLSLCPSPFMLCLSLSQK